MREARFVSVGALKVMVELLQAVVLLLGKAEKEAEIVEIVLCVADRVPEGVADWQPVPDMLLITETDE